MENALENKAKFFAQYWGQELGVQNEGGGSGFKYEINEATICDIQRDYLLLTPLSQITDEDAKRVCDLNYLEVNTLNNQQIQQIIILINSKNWNKYEIYDYLRSKGYAIPWMGLSVQQMIEYGWIKLKQS